MFDTVSYTCFLALPPPSDASRPCPPGWTRADFSREAIIAQATFDLKLENSLLGIRVFGRQGVIVKVEVDLPKLLYGHNGRLIATQSEVDTALARLKSTLQRICEPLGQHLGFFPGDCPNDTQTRYTRVDLVWQFDIDPGRMLLALRSAKYPEIHKSTGQYAQETVVFPGTKLHISAYDKKAKMRSSQDGNVMRVEVRYEDQKIAEHFSLGDSSLIHLDINAAYAAYRGTLLKFQFHPAPDLSVRGTLEDFLAWVTVKLPDDDPVAVYCSTKHLCKRKSRDLRKAVGRRVPSLVGFSWGDLLPEGRLPPIVAVPRSRKEALIIQLFRRLEGPA